MSILLFTADDDAADALSAALSRLEERCHHSNNRELAEQACSRLDPLVVVIDTTVEGYVPFVEQVTRGAPWRRNFLLVEPHRQHVAQPLLPAIEKPFDASEIAALLSRERQLAESDRRERQAQRQAREYALLVEASFEAIIGLCPQGIIESWNPGAQQVYGYGADEVMGRHYSLLEIDVSGSSGLPKLAHAVETRRRHKDGHEVIVLLSRSQVDPADGNTRLGFAEVSLDVTARHALERELEHAKRLATIGRLSAVMSHEINTPLTVVRSSSAWMREQAQKAGDAELADAAQDIEVAAERIGQFSEQVCGFARRNQAQVRNASLQPALDLALRMVRPRAAEKQVSVTLAGSEAVDVPHDAARLAQVLINVLNNAIDAAAEGGRQVVLRSFRHDQQLCVEVDDNGPGIAAEMRDQLFELFSTSKPFGKGTGLGLALSRQIMTDHQGSIQLLSLPNGGTRALLTLPRAERSHSSKLDQKHQPHA